MDETGQELSKVNNTEVVPSQPKEGLFSSLKRRIFGGEKSEIEPATTPQDVANLREIMSQGGDFRHPGDKNILAQQEAASGSQTQQQEAKPSFLEPVSPDDLPLAQSEETQTQPTVIGEAPVAVPETPPTVVGATPTTVEAPTVEKPAAVSVTSEEPPAEVQKEAA